MSIQRVIWLAFATVFVCNLPLKTNCEEGLLKKEDLVYVIVRSSNDLRFVDEQKQLRRIGELLQELPDTTTGVYPAFIKAPEFFLVIKIRSGKVYELQIHDGIVVLSESGALLERDAEKIELDQKLTNNIRSVLRQIVKF